MKNQIEKYTRTIELKELMINVLLYWRRIFIIGISLALILGGYKYYTGFRTLNDGVTVNGQNAFYESLLATYESEKNILQQEINNLESSIDSQKQYNENSVLMRIDPYNQYVLNMGYYVETDYKIMPEMTYQNTDITKTILRTYDSLAQTGKLCSYVRENLSYEIDSRYLNEILSLYVDYDNNMVFIKIVNLDKSSCEEIAQWVRKFMNFQNEEITKSIGEFKLTNVFDSIITEVDLNLITTQKQNLQYSTDYKNSLEEKKNELNNLSKPIKSVLTNVMVLKSAIKYAIVGLVLGVFISVIILALSYISSDKLLDMQELKNRYNLKIIGIYHQKVYKSIFGSIDQMIFRLKGNSLLRNNQTEEIKQIAAKLNVLIHNEEIKKGSILLTGTTSIEKISKLSTQISEQLKVNEPYRIIYSNNINYDADAIIKLGECDAVVIIEEINVSTYGEINNELENIYDFDKKLIGVIVLA